MAQRQFFERPTGDTILKDKTLTIVTKNLITRMAECKPRQVIGVPHGVFNFYIPSVRAPNRHIVNPRKFLRHGEAVHLTPDENFENLKEFGETPLELFLSQYRALHSMKRHALYAAVTWQPYEDHDRATRRVGLEQMIEGAKLFAYSTYYNVRIELNMAIDNARKVPIDGAAVGATIPSRTQKRSRYTEVVLSSIPVEDNNFALRLALALDIPPITMYRKVGERQYAQEGKKTIKPKMFEAHGIAAYWTMAEQYEKVDNSVPRRFSPFVIPTQFLVDVYNNALFRTVFEREEFEKDSPDEEPYPTTQRGPKQWWQALQGHKESSLHAAIVEYGPDACIYQGDNPYEHMRKLQWLPADRLLALRFAGEPHPIIQKQQELAATTP